MSFPSSPWRTFRAPLLVAAVSLFGLVSALLGDGLWDALSWAMLAVPLLLIGWFWLRVRPR